jgi:16S rRNA G527 N7-methylase RsmG
MYTLAYVEHAARQLGLQTVPRHRFRIENFATKGAALARARAIIAQPRITAVELHTSAGEVVLDAGELASVVGATARLPIAVAPELIA